MSVTALSIAFVAVAFVASGVIFLFLWERARIEREAMERARMIDVSREAVVQYQY